MPIKRNEYLKPISREHHHSLLLCWKIKMGFRKGIDPVRIKSYVTWFYNNHILEHFDIEERYIFPILGNDHMLVQKALSDHKRLIQLFETVTDLEENLKTIEIELDDHIRFEERVLFNEVQDVATAEQLELISIHHTEEKFFDNEKDAFWI